MLAGYQKSIQAELYKQIVNENQHIINLTGVSGCGKTETVLSLSEVLIDDWKILYIKGLSQDNPPYSTWRIAHDVKIYENKFNLSVGLNFTPATLGFPILMNFGYQRNLAKNSFFTENEICIIHSILKSADASEHILIIADDFEKWDVSSSEMIRKMMSGDMVIENKQFYILLVTKHPTTLGLLETMKKASDEEYLEILRSRNKKDIDIAKVREIAGDNLNLAFMLVDYFEEQCVLSLENIIESILENSDLLKSSGIEKLSIISGVFSKSETAYLLEKSQLVSERLLNNAKSFHLIEGNKKYYFPDENIRNYFKIKLDDEVKYIHIQFVQYLQNNYPEDYYNRIYHMILGAEATDIDKTVSYALQLLLIEYSRRWTQVENKDDINNILVKFDDYLTLVSSSLQKKMKSAKNSFLQGLQYLNSYKYNKAVIELSMITTPIHPAFQIEILCMLLLCYIKLGKKNEMLSTSEQLSSWINDSNCTEDELICRSSLILLDVYLDKAEFKDLAATILNLFHRTISKHIGKIKYEEFSAALNRKASLSFPPNIAIGRISDSVEYYSENNQIVNSYMALCNRSANYILNQQFDDANSDLESCEEMLLSTNEIHFPSDYKVKNNRYLLDICKTDKAFVDKIIDREQYKEKLEEIYSDYDNLLHSRKDEVSFVIELNHLALSLLLAKKDVGIQLDKLQFDVSNTDLFYAFYINNLKFAYQVTQNNIDGAKDTLEEISKMRIPLLDPFDQILKTRFGIQKVLLEKEFQGDIIDFHFYFRKQTTRVQDDSYYFFMKGLLFSDLQFLSL